MIKQNGQKKMVFHIEKIRVLWLRKYQFKCALRVDLGNYF